jgi:hypothetical protein
MPKSNTTVIGLDGLSKPASKLIDAISRAIGTVYAPTHIKRIAKANAESELIKAKADIDKQELQKRAVDRVALSETRRQKNIESISEKAFFELPKHSNNTQPNDDWMAEFFNLCQDVSDENLHILWARVLAGEVSTPGKYSLRSMQLLKTLDTREATLFYDYCSGVCCFRSKSDEVYARVLGAETNEILFSAMTHMDVIHLAEIGLVSYKAMQTKVMRGLYQEFDELEYFHHKFRIEEHFSWVNPITWFNFLRPREIEMEALTELGTELLSVAKGQHMAKQLKAIKQVLKFSGIRTNENRF